MNEINQDTQPTPVEEQPSQETAPEVSPTKPESRFKRVFLRVIRWMLIMLIVFGLGAITVIFSLYLPSRETVREYEAKIEASNQQIADLNQQIQSLKSLEEQNKALEEELEKTEMHLIVLSALSDVNAARLALAEEDVASARSYLTNTPDSLNKLANLVQPDQRTLINSMQDRLELALSEMDEDIFAGQSDLGVLASNLTQFENTLFASP